MSQIDTVDFEKKIKHLWQILEGLFSKLPKHLVTFWAILKNISLKYKLV